MAKRGHAHKPAPHHPWVLEDRATVPALSGSYVPTIADRLLAEADRGGVAHASAVDDAQDLGSVLTSPDDD